ncbi:MAG TPA: serine/threonine-protein kinase [Kofleriaceae bacterium]|nr:serine/threonine-protein kinase [Kofleriaceae bacterium]
MSRIGTSVGNYHLNDILGRGGMGTVYSGEHVYIGKRVAVKVLHPRFAKYEDAVKRFLREARAASSINHPNIVDVTDFGPTPDGGVYFVMEYLEGTSLEDLIEKRGALALHRGLNVANQLALALAAAHDKGIIHRDLKPDNIMLIRKPGRRDLVRMLRPDPRDDLPTARFVIEKEQDYDFVKILDFGIAKVLHREEMAPGQTLAGAVFGTPEYMSPEAARGEEVDPRADIYSAGVILFDMLTGRPPFEASAAAEVLAMQINKAPPSPREIAPHLEITEAAERLILKAMSKDADLRHQTMDEFRDELQRCYGSVAYRRHTQLPGEHARGAEARRKRLTEELDDWLHSDQNRLTIEQARQIAMAEVAEHNTGFDLLGEPTEPHVRPDEFDD